ncbi:uncharacterized protein LOC126236924 isoform X1 [Schistocerca nitens]|uniref:uncharacterized protein LOC126236924 isoform X1 n=1 Tax=Schistocerca nitens TaxID=7011 RepID=UPI002118BEAE|nr:uncharacterized protein LOC126236924 isoform X1 [Schistocerca nitens]
MEWSTETALKLIECYRERECLWDPTNCDYKNKLKRLDAWREISELLERNVNDVRKKMESLLTSFRRERQREANQTGSGSDEVYRSTWFAFSSMGFLHDKVATKKSGTQRSFHNRTLRKDISTPRGSGSATAKRSYNEETDGEDKGNDEPATTPDSCKKSRISDPSAPNQSNHSRADMAYDLNLELNEKRCPRDESSIYGDYIAAKHRKYSQHTKSVVEHLVGQILFKADMGLYETEFTTPHPQPQNRFYNSNKQHVSSTHTRPSPSLLQTYSAQSPSPSNAFQTNDAELHQNTCTPTTDTPPPQSIYKVSPVPPEDSDLSP